MSEQSQPNNDEYTDAMLAAMDLIWGEGFMAPGGEGHIHKMLADLNVASRHILDIGCGQGQPACVMAQRYGARVSGIDIEGHLIRRATQRAADQGLSREVEFLHVRPGSLPFTDNMFDVVVISGALTQMTDKHAMYDECLRVLRPGGTLSCYDWMKPNGPLSNDMLEWFELEGLTYALWTMEEHQQALADVGFVDSQLIDASAWYRTESERESHALSGELRAQLCALLGEPETQRFIDSWRLLAKLCGAGELLQVYTRATGSS